MRACTGCRVSLEADEGQEAGGLVFCPLCLPNWVQECPVCGRWVLEWDRRGGQAYCLEHAEGRCHYCGELGCEGTCPQLREYVRDVRAE